jgi:hypothetical protein
VFLVLMVDEHHNEVSGCGIDKSVSFMKQLEKQFDLNLFNRLQVELLTPGGLKLTTKQGAQSMLDAGLISTDTTTFDKSVTRKEAFDNAFMLPFSRSWAYGKKPQIA